MVDFPNGTPVLTDIALNDPPGSAAGGIGLRTLINRANDNLLALISAQYNNPIDQHNIAINGGPIYWPENTTFTSIANAVYGPEMWAYIKNGAVVHNLLRSTDVPAITSNAAKILYSLHLDVTTADASIASTDYSAITYIMEGYGFNLIAQRQFTIRFWVKSSKTGIHCVAFRNSGNDRSYVAEYTVNAADTWEEKSITVSASPSAGTWNYTNGTGLKIAFTQYAGSGSQTTANAWNTGNFLATANQVNVCDNAANNFKVCGLAIQPGPYCRPYVPRGYGLEKALASRYFQKTYVDGVPTATDTLLGIVGTGTPGSGAANVYLPVVFSPPMRTTPTVSTWGKAGGANKFYDVAGAADHDASNALSVSENGFYSVNNVTVTETYFIHYAANARMTP